MEPHRMIAAARAIERQTQQQLADELSRLSGRPWTRNAVAAIENGRRAFEVADLDLFARAQRRDVAWYFGGSTSRASGGSLDPMLAA